MEIRILTQETIELNGEQVTSYKEIGSTSAEQLQKDLEVVMSELTRIQQLVTNVNTKIALVDAVGDKNYIIL